MMSRGSVLVIRHCRRVTLIWFITTSLVYENKNNGDKIYRRKSMQAVNEKPISYSAKFSWVFNFSNFQSFAKIFRRKFLTSGVQCVHAANSQNYFNEILKNRYSRKFGPLNNLALYGNQ